MECRKEVIVDGVRVYEDKMKYATLEEAITACKVLNSYDDRVQKLVSYKCKECFKFHIGRNGSLIKDKDKTKMQIKLAEKKVKKSFSGFKVVGFVDLDRIK